MPDQSELTPSLPFRLVMVDVTTIRKNELQWAEPTDEQLDAINDLYDQVSWVGAGLVNERSAATGWPEELQGPTFVDGHKRAEMLLARGERYMPVLIGDWTEEEEKLALQYINPTGIGAKVLPEQWLALRDFNAGKGRMTDALESLSTRAEFDYGIIRVLNPNDRPGEGPAMEFAATVDTSDQGTRVGNNFNKVGFEPESEEEGTGKKKTPQGKTLTFGDIQVMVTYDIYSALLSLVDLEEFSSRREVVEAVLRYGLEAFIKDLREKPTASAVVRDSGLCEAQDTIF